MSNHNICFCGEIRKIVFGYPLLSVAMLCQSQNKERKESKGPTAVLMYIDVSCDSPFNTYVCVAHICILICNVKTKILDVCLIVN